MLQSEEFLGDIGVVADRAGKAAVKSSGGAGEKHLNRNIQNVADPRPCVASCEAALAPRARSGEVGRLISWSGRHDQFVGVMFFQEYLEGWQIALIPFIALALRATQCLCRPFYKYLNVQGAKLTLGSKMPLVRQAAGV